MHKLKMLKDVKFSKQVKILEPLTIVNRIQGITDSDF